MNFALVVFWLVGNCPHIKQFQEIVEFGVDFSVLFQYIKIAELHSYKIFSTNRIELLWKVDGHNWMDVMGIKFL